MDRCWRLVNSISRNFHWIWIYFVRRIKGDIERKVRWEISLSERQIKFLGAWPSNNWANFIRFSITIFVFLTSLLTLRFLFVEWGTGTVHVCVASLTSIVSSMIIILWGIRRNDFEELMNHMEIYWEYIKYSTDETRATLEKYMMGTRYICIVSITFTSTVSLSVSSIPLVLPNFTNESSNFYIDSLYPPWTRDSPFFQLLLFNHLVILLYTAVIMSAVNPLFFIVITNCCGQLRLLCEAIERNDRRIQHRNPRRRYYCSCVECIVERHWAIIKFFEAINKFVNPSLTIAHGFINIFTISILYFYWQPTPHPKLMLMASWPYVIASTCWALVYCYYGELITTESENIPTALLACNLYSLPKRELKSYLIMLNYAQNRPLQLKFGGFFILNNLKFKNSVSLWYSIFSLFRTIYSKRMAIP